MEVKQEAKILPEDSEPEYFNMTIESLLQSLSSCRIVTLDIITELAELRRTISTHRGAVLKAKTGGTAATTVGTGLAVTGLILAPFTFGASLIVSSVGAVTTVGGAAANMIADIVDGSKRKKYLQNIQKFGNDQQASKRELAQMLAQLEELLNPFLELGLSKPEALYATLISGDRSNLHHSDQDKKRLQNPENSEFEWIDDDPSNWKRPVKRFAFKAGIQSLKLVKSSHALSVATAVAGVAGRSGGSVVASTASNVSLGVGRLLGNVVLKSSLAAVGVLFTSIDIAFLVREWKAVDPTGEAVDYVREELREEVGQIEELQSILAIVANTVAFKGRVEGVNIVGTSPFNVKALMGLLLGSGESTKFYGDLEMDIIDQNEWEEEFWVGSAPYPGHKIRYLNSKFVIETEPVTEICQLFPKSDFISEENESIILKIHVVNQSVLSIYSALIEALLKAQNLPKFQILEPLFAKNNCSQIITDFYSPFPKHDLLNMTQVCVAYVKCSSGSKEEAGYLNANRWEYELILKLVQKLAVEYFSKVFKQFDENENNEDEQLDENLVEGDEISELVEVLINHKSYLDPVAVTVWKGNEKNAQVLAKVEQSLEGLFRNLRFKLGLWAGDVYDVGKLMKI